VGRGARDRAGESAGEHGHSNGGGGRKAVRDQIAGGADWIKLFPGGAYSFSPAGEAQYVTTYPLPVLQALIDETHKLGRKAGCHVFGGLGLQNTIDAGCDTVEHAYGLTQAQADQMAGKSSSTTRRCSATSNRTWTTTTRKTPAASSA